MRGGVATGYTYDAANRVRASSAGESWEYDANGNTTSQRMRDGDTNSSEYNAENRATRTVGTAEGKTTTSVNRYDAVGNIVNTRVDGDGFGFDEVTQRDVRYLERSKRVANSYAKGAKGLEGASSFSYDSNGNLTLLDRGRKTGANQNSIGSFEYDLEGQIIARSDRPTPLGAVQFFQGYVSDPDTMLVGPMQAEDNGWGGISLTQQEANRIFGAGNTGGTVKLQSYLYANHKPIAEASGEQQAAFKKLSLAEPVFPVYEGGPNAYYGDGNMTGEFLGYAAHLQQEDLRYQGDGAIDRAATAHALASRVYVGWTDLSASGQAKVAAYVLEQLPGELKPATPNSLGSEVILHRFILMTDGGFANGAQITDYSLRQIGADGLPAGTVQSHQVRAGDTLQSIAAMYFGSPAYWYLVADANGLTGNEPLAEGTTLTIPNAVANSVNDADTFKVYNESEIIGSTSPEIRTVKKKKKWYQKLIQIIIIVIMIVAAAFIGPMALGIFQALGGGLIGTLGAMAFGAVAMAGVNIVTQGLAVAAGLQEKFSWKAVGKAAIAGAFSALATVAGAQFAQAGQAAQAGAGASGATSAASAATNWTSAINWAEVGVRVGVEGARQLVMDGKISSVAGLVGAALPGMAPGLEKAGAVANWIKDNARVVGAGLSMLESKLRGQGDNAMQWVKLATSALFDGKHISPAITDDHGAMNWQYVAVQALGSVIVGSRMGEDAGLNYFGEALGNGIAERMHREKAIDDRAKALADNEVIGARFKALDPQAQRDLAIMAVDRNAGLNDALVNALRGEGGPPVASFGSKVGDPDAAALRRQKALVWLEAMSPEQRARMASRLGESYAKTRGEEPIVLASLGAGTMDGFESTSDMPRGELLDPDAPARNAAAMRDTLLGYWDTLTTGVAERQQAFLEKADEWRQGMGRAVETVTDTMPELIEGAWEDLKKDAPSIALDAAVDAALMVGGVLLAKFTAGGSLAATAFAWGRRTEKMVALADKAVDAVDGAIKLAHNLPRLAQEGGLQKAAGAAALDLLKSKLPAGAAGRDAVTVQQLIDATPEPLRKALLPGPEDRGVQNALSTVMETFDKAIALATKSFTGDSALFKAVAGAAYRHFDVAEKVTGFVLEHSQLFSDEKVPGASDPNMKAMGPIQNKSGHGIDWMGRARTGKFAGQFVSFEVKAGLNRDAKGLSSDQGRLGVHRYTLDRINRAATPSQGWQHMAGTDTQKFAQHVQLDQLAKNYRYEGFLVQHNRMTSGRPQVSFTPWR